MRKRDRHSYFAPDRNANVLCIRTYISHVFLPGLARSNPGENGSALEVSGWYNPGGETVQLIVYMI
jgi:hypothetical protein